VNSGQLTRKQLRALEARGALPVAAHATPGAQIGLLASSATDEDRNLVDQVLGRSVILDGEKLSAVVRTTREVRRESIRFFESSVAVGRAVNRLRSILERGEFTRVIGASPRLFGLSRSIIIQLMAVADGVDQNIIPVEIAPRSYSVYYQLAILPPETRRLAIEQEVLRPDVTRSEIMAFKQRAAANNRRLSGLGSVITGERSRKARRAELLRVRDRLEHELKAVEAELRRIEVPQAS